MLSSSELFNLCSEIVQEIDDEIINDLLALASEKGITSPHGTNWNVMVSDVSVKLSQLV